MKTNIEKGIKYSLYHGTNENQHKKNIPRLSLLPKHPGGALQLFWGCLAKVGLGWGNYCQQKDWKMS